MAIFLNSCLLLADSADGAALFTSAAINADVRINLEVDVAHANSLNGAGLGASAAGDASIADLSCHTMYLLLQSLTKIVFRTDIVTSISQKASTFLQKIMVSFD